MKKYYLIGVLVFLAAVFGYHFLAADQAEEQIHSALQEANNTEYRTSIQYSSIEISPFTGNMMLEDLIVIQDSTIRRIKSTLIDLDYWDFLKIYIGGLQFGTEHLNEAKLSLIQPSQVKRNSLTEIKFDTLSISYSGNAWDLIQQIIHQKPFETTHIIQADGKALRLTGPGGQIGSISSKTANLTVTLQQGTLWAVPAGDGELNLETITWTPTSGFQQNYAFFIKGFGFEPDSIPVQEANFSWQMEPSLPGFTFENGKITTELCEINLDGKLVTSTPFENPRLEEVSISISNFSEQFSTVLKNMEQLMNISLPKEGNRMVFGIGGTLKEPVILNNR